MDIKNLGFGGIGSSVYVGLTLGSLTGSKVYSN